MTTNSVVKAFRIIEHLSTHSDAGCSETAVALGMDKTTVHRLLATMKEIGYVSQNASSQRYSLSAKFSNLTEATPDHRSLLEIIRPYLKELAEMTGETASLALLSGTEVIYTDHIDSQHVIKVNVGVGIQYPAHTVGIGKVILANLKPEHVEELYRGRELEKLTPNTIDSFPKLMADLVKTKKRGYAIDNEECSTGLFCLAAAVLDSSGLPVAGISTGFPLFRHPSVAAQKKLAEMVCLVTGRISESLGYGGQTKGSKAKATKRKKT